MSSVKNSSNNAKRGVMTSRRAAATGVMRDRSMAYPVNMPGFIQKTAPVIEAREPYVVEIYESDFIEGGKSYSDLKVDGTNPGGAARMLLWQLWLFALHVLSVRVDKNILRSAEYPVHVFLECINAVDPLTGVTRRTNGQRLWIFEDATTEKGMLLSILISACISLLLSFTCKQVKRWSMGLAHYQKYV